MKPVNFEKILFPLNAIITAVVFFLLKPSTYIYAQWFPDKKDSLWLIPAGVIFTSAVLWLLTSLNLPKLIQKGVFEDRRKNDRSSEEVAPMNVRRTLWPVLVFIFHMALIAGMCASLIVEMRSDTTGHLLFNNIVWRAP